MKPPSLGGEAVERLASLPHRPTGEYFAVFDNRDPTLPGTHETLARQLWAESEAAVGVAWPGPIEGAA